MIAGLLLAAGGARRFGSQKLLAQLDGQPLVRHAANVLISTTDRVTVVVGNDARQVQSTLNDLDADVVDNAEWATGLASSLRCGIAALPVEAEAVVVALGDQPRVDAIVIREVIARWRAGGRAIVATRYAGVQGHPVLFDRAVFDELLALEGDRGAKSVIERIPERVEYVDVHVPAPRDVDTPDDLAALGG
ncbi:MAG TPA: nucleotidyltransferase family protein [Gemmatimonadaceae bacterium]